MVLVDVNLFAADGFDVVLRLRQSYPAYNHIVLLSNARTASDVERAAMLGVRVLVKPSGLQESVRFLRELSVQRRA
jgi:DNA-binding response OmpR family regulator